MHTVLILAKIATMTLGFIIAYQAYRGYKRNNSPPMFYLAVGFILISFGAVIEAILYEIIGLTIFNASAIQTTIVAVGMIIILYSLYGRQKLSNNKKT